MRLFKLFNHHPGLKVIITSMQYSSSVLWLLIFFVLIAVAVFASLIYYAERMTTRHPMKICLHRFLMLYGLIS